MDISGIRLTVHNYLFPNDEKKRKQRSFKIRLFSSSLSFLIYYLNQNSNSQRFFKEGRRLNLTYLSIRRNRLIPNSDLISHPRRGSV
jgi:hypothetical protein